ncbi:hypothetical protein HID58_068635, partial [Brassica napus]
CLNCNTATYYNSVHPNNPFGDHFITQTHALSLSLSNGPKMNILRPPPTSSSSFPPYTNSAIVTAAAAFTTTHNPISLCSINPPPFTAAGLPTRRHFFARSASGTANSSAGDLSSFLGSSPEAYSTHNDQELLSLLRNRRTDEAWAKYVQSTHLPGPTCLSRLVSQLSYQSKPESLTRAQSILTRLRNERQLHRLDANSLGLLAMAAAKSGQTLYAVSVIKSMLRSGYLPHVKAWTAAVANLSAAGDDGPEESIKLFTAITRRVRRFGDQSLVAQSRPDTAAFNAVLNACANIGDTEKYSKLFCEMSEWDCEPDVLTYNVMIKLCARVGRKELIVFVVERIIEKGVKVCMTTMHSLVAAYVGFGDLRTAERIVQAMREKRRDLCKVLRELIEEGSEDAFKKLLPNSVNPSDEPPLLPKAFAPDSRIYTTLMKGYMKNGRVADTARMLEAMRRQDDKNSHPDEVTYTTVVSAFVKAGLMDRARQVLAEMARMGVPANRITYNVLLKGYCKQLQIDKAEDLLREMAEDAGIEPDVVSYNIIIDGCILIDDSAGALSFFNEMRTRGIAPTKISYTTLMKAFAMSGQPKLANRVFDEMMRDPRVKVDLIAWNMLVEGYCRLGLIEDAKRVVSRMKENGFHPNVATYGSLANGVSLARKPGEALLLWKEIKERCVPDEGLLDMLADICVRAAFFKKALEIIACMEENGIPPNKTKFKKIYVEMHSRMFTSKHASQARVERRVERKRAAEAFKFWLGLPNSYYGSEWKLGPRED